MSDLQALKDALSVLENAAKDGSDEVKNVLNSEYEKLGKKIFEVPESAWHSFKKAKTMAVDYTVDKAKVVDRSVHENPWYYLGGAALIAGIIGYLLGRSSK